ncbi:MAG: cysteine dioxygenase [Alphaproteobacteria bacterium]|nr:cysteine dioxygenase [Alphaproteobacteria bacterium]
MSLALAESRSIAQRREAAVAATLAKVRRIERERGVNRDALEAIKRELMGLTADRSLFPPEHFPLNPDGGNVAYRLSEDADHRFALYVSTGKTGRETPPHDHTTWAVIVGIKGKEHNRFYRRADDRSQPGKGRVVEVDRATVEHGTGVTLMPEDIHSIHLEGEPPTLMVHMYGLALDHLHRRVAYNAEDGTYRHFPPNSDIRKPVA